MTARCVWRFAIQNKRGVHLFTGDMTPSSWRAIRMQVKNMNLPILSLSAPHHGGEAVLREMWNDLRPRYVVVSANTANVYDHPRSGVLRDLSLITPAAALRSSLDALARLKQEIDGASRFWDSIISGIYPGLDDHDRIAAKMDAGLPITPSEMMAFRFPEDAERDKPPQSDDPMVIATYRLARSQAAVNGSMGLDAHGRKFPTDNEVSEFSRQYRESSRSLRGNLARLEAMVNERMSKTKQAASRRTGPHYRRLLFTGVDGDVTFRGGVPTRRALDANREFLNECAFLQLRRLTHAELASLKSWPKAQMVCLLLVAHDLRSVADAVRLKDRVPDWATEYELAYATSAHRRGVVFRSGSANLAASAKRFAQAAIASVGEPQSSRLLSLYEAHVAKDATDRAAVAVAMRTEVDRAVEAAAAAINNGSSSIELPRFSERFRAIMETFEASGRVSTPPSTSRFFSGAAHDSDLTNTFRREDENRRAESEREQQRVLDRIREIERRREIERDLKLEPR
jgi:hypothetical protein